MTVKYADDLDDLRVVENLQIEKVFWVLKGYQWKVFTEQEITPSIKENLEWLHAANQNLDGIYSELSKLDVQFIFQRLKRIKKRLTTTCAALDDEYSCDPGFHIGIFRKAVAANLIDAPLNIVFRQWSCSDLTLVQSISVLSGGFRMYLNRVYLDPDSELPAQLRVVFEHADRH